MGYLLPPSGVPTQTGSFTLAIPASGVTSSSGAWRATAVGFNFQVRTVARISAIQIPITVSGNRMVGLWDSSGNLLSSGTVVGPSKDASLSPVVTLTPGTEYVIGCDMYPGEIWTFISTASGPADPTFIWGTNKQGEGPGQFPYYTASPGLPSATPGARNFLEGLPATYLFQIALTGVTYTNSASVSIWPEATTKTLPNAFTIQLPTELLPNNLKEWDLQAAVSGNDGIFDPWMDIATIDGSQVVYTHSNLDSRSGKPFYLYRYKLRNQLYQESDWSEPAYAGAVSTIGTADAASSVGIPDTPGSVDGSNIANGSILPAHITTIAGNNFTFPGTVKSNAGGFIFPDGTTQTTAAASHKYASNLGAITANTALTINHALATSDVIVQFRTISSGAQVDIAYTVVDGNNITITLPNSVAANTYRVVVFG